MRSKELLIWFLATCVAFVLALYGFYQKGLEENILTLVPEDAVDARVEETNRIFIASLERKVFFAVSDKKAAEALSATLKESTLCDAVYATVTADEQKALYTFLNTYRLAFLDNALQHELKEPQLSSAFVLSQVFNPFAGVGIAELQNDPLLLTRRVAQGLTKGESATFEDGWVVAKDKKGTSYYLVEALLSDKLTLTDATNAIEEKLSHLQSSYPNASFVKQGIAFYTAHGVKSAMHDISLLGSLSFAGLLLVFWLGFRSVRPFALCLISVVAGLIFASAATYLVFGTLHAATLVMSTSLIGISADYTTYYLTRRMQMGRRESSFASRDALKGSLLHAVLTSSLAYAVMLLAPLPGLRQFALFGAVGLLAACLTVLIVFPYLVTGFPVRELPMLKGFTRWISLWKGNPIKARAVCLTFVALFSLGLFKLQTSDNLTAMQTLDMNLKGDEVKFTELFNRDMTQHWFIAIGKDAEDALTKEQALEEKLEVARSKGLLSGFDAFHLNTLATQEKLLTEYIHTSDCVKKNLESAGIHLGKTQEPKLLTLEDYLKSPLARSAGFRASTLSDQSVAIILTVKGLKDESMMNAIAKEIDGVSWYSRKASFENLFYSCRTTVAALLSLSFVAIFIVFVRSFGLKAGLVGALCSLFSLTAALGAMGWLGIPLHLFSLFSLILVLGIGIDYVVFFHRHRDASASVSFATTIAMVTTLLSLGILVLSSTAAISNFGLVLFLGITASYLIAPMILTVKQ